MDILDLMSQDRHLRRGHIVWTFRRVLLRQIKDFCFGGGCSKTGIYHGDKDNYAGKEDSCCSKWGRQSRDCKESIFGPVIPGVPASILQMHNDVILVGDEAALSLI